MIGIVLLLALFICVSSIFFPTLRKLAMAIITTVAILGSGLWIVFEMVSK